MPSAEKVKEYRKKRNFSQIELSNRSGVSQSTISSLERGEKSPSESTLVLLAKALRVPVSELLEEEKTAANDGDGLKEEISNLLLSLSDEELRRVCDYAEYLISRRGE